MTRHRDLERSSNVVPSPLRELPFLVFTEAYPCLIAWRRCFLNCLERIWKHTNLGMSQSICVISSTRPLLMADTHPLQITRITPAQPFLQLISRDRRGDPRIPNMNDSAKPPQHWRHAALTAPPCHDCTCMHATLHVGMLGHCNMRSSLYCKAATRGTSLLLVHLRRLYAESPQKHASQSCIADAAMSVLQSHQPDAIYCHVCLLELHVSACLPLPLANSLALAL